ncbi:MAG: nuclear transport factor 2 family protein [bacterium]|nr:nuclear transport factor 2 family protein [bacterium]
MKFRFALKTLVLILPLSLSVYAQFTQTAYSQSGAVADTQEIRKAISEIERAFVARDPEPFDRLYMDGYVNVRDKPIFNYRDQLSAMIKWDSAAQKTGKKLDLETLSYDSDLPSVQVFGDVAVVNILKRNLWRYRGDRCLTQYQTTELWIRSQAGWKIAAAHMSTIQCEQNPGQPSHPALAEIRPIAKPVKFISVAAETELRELLSTLNDAGMKSDTNADAFAPEYVFTATNASVSKDRQGLLEALKIPTMRNRERYRDDEVFLSFGPAAIYLFRIRSFPKAGQTTPPPPIVFSVMFARTGSDWRIVAAHASELTD